MLLHTWLPATLRNAGLKVVETPGWAGRSHGQLPQLVKVVWHHDASPPGDSPGALNWMIANWNNSSAQVWVDNYGTWHLVGAGIAWHAGTVQPGMPGNKDSIGIETDQTTGEAWPAAQLDALRRGTAAILARQAVPTSWLHFHKTICAPAGRKVDPAGLTLADERAAVARILTGAAPPSSGAPPSSSSKPPAAATPPAPTPPKDTNDMADITPAQMDQIAQKVCDRLLNGPGTTVRVNTVDDKTGKEVATDMKYRDAISQAATSAARAAYRAKT